MPKCRIRDFTGLASAILEDCAAYYPTSRLEFERDLVRLKSQYENQGDSVFTLHLPALAKHLEASLESGCLTRCALPLSRSINTRTTVPRLFRTLWLQIFSYDGCLNQDIDPNAIFFLRQLLLVGKKFKSECPKPATYAAVKDFYDVDDSLPPESALWSTDGRACYDAIIGSVSDVADENHRDGVHPLLTTSEPEDGRRPMLGTVQEVLDRISMVIGDFIPGNYRFRHGPGATAEFSRGRGYKYAFPAWNPRLQFVFPGEEFAFANASLLGPRYELPSSLPLKEGASVLHAVPKTQKGPRLIAAEPTCNQWCQQAVRDFLDQRIRDTFLGRSIDFSRQDLSQERVRTASVSREEATIDLSSASDRLSCYLVERAFRRNKPLLAALIATRTRFVTQTIDKKSPRLHRMRKFSSMGSALTFPIQSIVFFGLCLGAGASLGWDGTDKQLRSLGRRIRVYGDDLIVPVEWVPRIRVIFKSLFLKINETKTFVNSKFRESCGLDAWNGSDVTPAYFLQWSSEAEPTTIAANCVIANNFFKKGLWATAAFVDSLAPQWVRKYLPVVKLGSGHLGSESFCGYRLASPRRWNADLQRDEYQALMVKTRSPDSRYEGHANLLQYFTEDPSSASPLLSRDLLRKWESGRFGMLDVKVAKGWLPVSHEMACQ